MFLKYFFFELVAKRLLKAHNENCCSLIKLLRRYFCYFIHGRPVLNNTFFQKLSVIGKISIGLSQKKASNHWNRRNNAQSFRQLYHGFPTLYRGRERIWNTLLKIPTIFFKWLPEIYKMKLKISFCLGCLEKLRCALWTLIILAYIL